MGGALLLYFFFFLSLKLSCHHSGQDFAAGARPKPNDTGEHAPAAQTGYGAPGERTQVVHS